MMNKHFGLTLHALKCLWYLWPFNGPVFWSTVLPFQDISEVQLTQSTCAYKECHHLKM